jgi:hypothetical protein
MCLSANPDELLSAKTFSRKDLDMKKIMLLLFVFIAGHSTLAANTACFEVFKVRAAGTEALQSVAVDFFVKHLRLPTLEELSEAADLNVASTKTIVTDYEIFWNEAVTSNPQKIDDVRAIIVRAYYDFARAQKRGGITPRSATELEIFSQLLTSSDILQADAKRGLFEVKHLSRILGLRARKPDRIPYPVLFEGLDGLRLAAKEKYPTTFKGMRDQRYGKTYNEETVSLLVNKYNGGAAVSFRGGIPWETARPWFQSLVTMAKDRNVLILIKEINGETDLIPAEIVNHPQVRIVTQTLDLGNELRVWGGLTIMPTNKNPHAGLAERMNRVPRGQSQIVFATQRAMTVLPTEKNAITGAHQIWSTGSLNDPIYPYSNFRSSRVSTLASEREILSAIVFEKSDQASGPLGRGAPGRWHITNVDYENTKTEWGAGIAHNFVFYPGDGSPARPIPALAVVPGDYHLGFQNELVLRAMGEQVFDPSIAAGGPTVYLRLHDFQSFEEISKWLGPSETAAMFARGELDLQQKINLGRATLNDLKRRYPNVVIVLSKEDNHHAWLYKAIDDPVSIDNPVNGPLLAKLRSIRDQGYDLLEYLYKDQQKMDDAIPDEVKRQKQLSSNVYVEHPESIIVLKRGQAFDVGPEGAIWTISQHGHVVGRGKRGGTNLDPHAKANDRSTNGHNHEGGIVGYSFNSAMIVRLLSQYYALGSYSGQQNAIIVIYPNGGGQMMIFDPKIGRFYADPKIGPLPAGTFFTSTPFVVDDPNDLVEPGITTLNNYENKPTK